jgi:UDP-2,3-diacylglucosamine pyrophosphatase LpxH
MERTVHVAADGRRYLVIHGDLFDLVVRHARWLAFLGNHAYDLAIQLNTVFNALRRALGLKYWSLSQWAKLKVKNAVNFIGEYENSLAREARRHQVDGVICGHIHHAAIQRNGDFTYINCGDWVESCTAIVEHFGGRMELIEWSRRDSRVEVRLPWTGKQRAFAAQHAKTTKDKGRAQANERA